MEYVLKCNELKCRRQLHERAVVTTCSHIFCTQCADATGLSRAHNANRACPACSAHLSDPDDVVIAGMSPSEAYRTSILSGLSPTIIMECASRALAFFSYQTSQEIIFQEHLAKSLTEKYASLNQQMDQLIMEANRQMKAMQEKMQAMQGEQSSLEQKNHELVQAFRDKSKAQQQLQKLYQSLKAQVMATQVANAAGDEVDAALHSVRGSRFIKGIPGTRKGAAYVRSFDARQQTGVGSHHRRGDSGSSGHSGEQRRGNGLAAQWATRSQGQGLHLGGNAAHPTAFGTPSQPPGQRSRLPTFGGLRHNGLPQAAAGSPYQGFSVGQPIVGGVSRRTNDVFGFGGKPGAHEGNSTENTCKYLYPDESGKDWL